MAFARRLVCCQFLAGCPLPRILVTKVHAADFAARERATLVRAVGRLRIGLFSPMHHLDPQVVQDYGCGQVINQIFEAPYRLEDDGTVKPEVFAGPLLRRLLGGGRVQVTGRIRPNAKFSDGSPVTASEVVDTLRRVPTIASSAELMAAGNEVRLTLPHDDPRLEVRLAHRWASVVKRVGDTQLGTGPFRLMAGGTPERIVLEPNPHARVQPKIEGVEFAVYPRSADGRPDALRQAIIDGKVDLTTALGRDDVSGLTGVRKEFAPGMSTATLSFNTESPALSDPEVRRAIVEAVDRSAVARISYENPHAFAARSVLPPSMWRRSDGVRHSPQQARARLAGSGVRPRKPLRMMMVWGPRPYMPHPEKTADLIAQQLEAIGLAVQLTPTLDSEDYRKRGQAGDYDLDLGGWIADTPDPHDFLNALFHSQSVPSDEVAAAYANNMSRYRSQRMDDALDRYRGDASEANLQAAMEVVTDEAPLCPLFYGPNIIVHGWHVRNIRVTAGGMPQLVDVVLD